ncbi:MAG TPA: hypothetical protein DHW38_12375, partial [Planctomycetaceae bacterium]|nr:hypothetical protein [Planctomycetaceae bacterium]
MTRTYQFLIAVTLISCCQFSIAGEKAPRRAFIDGTGPGWVTLTEKDFVDVNGTEDTWQFDGAY